MDLVSIILLAGAGLVIFLALRAIRRPSTASADAYSTRDYDLDSSSTASSSGDSCDFGDSGGDCGGSD